MTLEVIGAGFGRTGTLSMKHALELLGFDRTHHMEDVLRSRTQTELWHQVGRGLPPQWDAIFDGYKASVDFPSSTYYRELLEWYPDAKVVLTVRDVDGWYASTASTIYRMSELIPAWAVRLVPRIRQMVELTNATVWDRLFDGKFSDEARAKAVFLDYIETVKATVPENQLLVFDVSEGWEPLCQFLQCEVPVDDFPHVNDKSSFQVKIRALRTLTAAPYVAAVAIAVTAVARFA